ncbi:MAG TPA: histidine kinase dimerization/phospho-acceptor domain-containing protein, partial [Micromonosporaceae bacterium]
MNVVVAVSSFLLGAAAAAFLAAWFVRRSGGSAQPDAAPAGVLPRPSGLSQRVLGALDLGVVVMDRDEIAVYANPVARTMQVVDADRLAVPTLSELVRRVTDSGEPDSVSIDLPSAGRGPEYLTFTVRAMPLREQGRVSAVVLRFFDITDAHRLELVRRDFVANVSHELKTPVGAIGLLAEAIETASDEPAEVKRFAKRLTIEADRLARLTHEIIELSRLQSAEPLASADKVDIDYVIAQAVDQNRVAAESHRISLVSGGDAGAEVYGDEALLVTAVHNLIANAIQYSPDGFRVGIGVTNSNGVVEIAVTDQGVGIPESERDRVFERFFR